MDRKYWVPALERAHAVLQLISMEPSILKQSDLCKRLGISKSTMFSLLQTMEALNWVKRNASDTYTLGLHYGILGNAFFRQFDRIDAFRREAKLTMNVLQESIQLAKLEGRDVLYLAKEEAPSPVQMVSAPGIKFPAHATGLGKVLLSGLAMENVLQLFPDESLPGLTPFTITSREVFTKELEEIRQSGFAFDKQEGIMGFCCVAAPVYQSDEEMVSAVSCSIPLHHWEQKREQALVEILHLAQRLSFGK